MSKRSELQTEETTSLGSARDPIDACSEAAYRLNVVIRLLNEHECGIGGGGDAAAHDDTADEDEGGYDLSVMREALRDIRDMLRLTVRTEEAKEQKAGAR